MSKLGLLTPLVSIFAAIFLILALAPGAVWADDYTILIEDLTITPSSPSVGDELEIEVEFDVTVPSDPTVKLYLYIDGDQEDTYSSSYYSGDHSYEFSYDTDDLDEGSHAVKVIGQLYSNSDLKDVDSFTKSFTLGAKEGTHDLDIKRVQHASTVMPGDTLSVSVKVKNAGDVTESGIKISAQLGTVKETTNSFSLIKNAETTKTLTLTVPQLSGPQKLTVTAFSSKDQEIVISNVNVQEGELTLNAAATTAQEGDWIRIWGTANVVSTLTSPKFVDVYKDGIYSESARIASDGYWSTYVQFSEAGWHYVKVAVDSVEQDVQIKIESAPTTTVAGYVDAVLGARELNIEQYRSGTLEIEVTNHLSEEKLIKVTTDLPTDMTYLPKAEWLLPRQSATFTIYLAPKEVGTFTGNVSVTVDGEVVQEFPVSVFVREYTPREVQEPAVADFFEQIATPVYVTLGIVALVFLILFGLSALGFLPKRLPQLEIFGDDEYTKTQAKLPSDEKKTERAFIVPWSRIIK